jgi:hypothetical protein
MLMDAARAALETGLEAGIAAEGWQLVTLAWQRSRSAREAKPAPGTDGIWAGAVEFRARMLRA